MTSRPRPHPKEQSGVENEAPAGQNIGHYPPDVTVPPETSP
jgi:hypothetical protein